MTPSSAASNSCTSACAGGQTLPPSHEELGHSRTITSAPLHRLTRAATGWEGSGAGAGDSVADVAQGAAEVAAETADEVVAEIVGDEGCEWLPQH